MSGKVHAIRRIAESQHGVLTRDQAIAAGMSPSALTRALARGDWTRIYPGIYATRLDLSFEGRLVAETFRAPGRTWASHRSAAYIWGLDGARDDVVEITTVAGLRAGKAVIHRVDEVYPSEVRVRSRIPLTDVGRTLVDLGASVSRDRLEAAVIDALRRRLTTVSRLRILVEQHAKRGRSGPAELRRLFQEWGSLGAPESMLESRLRRMLVRHRLPPFTAQHEVAVRGAAYRIDVAYPEERVAVEADGFRWHGDIVRWRNDLARRNVLTAAGWAILHFTWSDLDQRPNEVAEEIMCCLGSRGKLGAT